MPIRLDTVLRKVEQMPNKVDSDLLKSLIRIIQTLIGAEIPHHQAVVIVEEALLLLLLDLNR
jgi:hypothetical protein